MPLGSSIEGKKGFLQQSNNSTAVLNAIYHEIRGSCQKEKKIFILILSGKVKLSIASCPL